MKKFTDFLSEGRMLGSSPRKYTYGEAHAKFGERLTGTEDKHGVHHWQVLGDRHKKVPSVEGKHGTRIHTLASACSSARSENTTPDDFYLHGGPLENGNRDIVHRRTGEMFTVDKETAKTMKRPMAEETVIEAESEIER
jgi:hypothetical protein